MSRQIVPNLLTSLRFMLIIPTLYLLWVQDYFSAFILFVLAGLTDALDGLLARRWKSISRFGSIMDPLADKGLLVSCLLMLFYLGYLPLWLLLSILVRDLFMALGALAYHFVMGKYSFKPNLLGKWSTALQVILLGLIMFHLSYPIIPNSIVWTFMVLVSITNVASLIQYVWQWGGKALQSNP